MKAKPLQILNDFKCTSCNDGDTAVLFSTETGRDGKLYDLYQCTNCSLITIWPSPTDEFLHDLYSKNYKGKFKERIYEKGDFIRNSKSQIEDIFTRISYIAKYRNLNQYKTLLDIGCGYGFTVYSATIMGFDAMGIDIDESALVVGRKALGVDLRFLGAYDVNSLNKKFDLITSWQVIEHLNNPKKMVKGVFNQLNNNGLFVAALPNIKGPGYRLRGSNWGLMNPPEHINYYSHRAINKLIKESGLKPVFVGTVPLYASPYFITGIRSKTMKFAQAQRSEFLKELGLKTFRLLTLIKRHIFYKILNFIIMRFGLEGDYIYFIAQKQV